MNMIDRLYGKYFQKSRSFLFPALGIKKESYFTPSGTYIVMFGKYGAEDMKLMVSFKVDYTAAYQDFESQMLLSNPLYLETISVGDYNIYVFDYQIYQNDWFSFLLGRYSKFSSTLKKAIKAYYGEHSSEYQYIETYLYPEKFYELYAKLLDMDVKDLKKIGELCDPWDESKETLKIPVENLETLRKDT